MIRLVQLLCPARHCIIAGLYDVSAGGTLEMCIHDLSARMVVLQVEHMCGICGSWSLEWEDRPTKFPDMKTALEICKICEADNVATRQYLDETGQSYKSKLKN